MATPRDQIEDLTTLNHIAETLNRAVDVYGALQTALVRLVELMRLETGWIFLVDQANSDKWWGKGYTLVAHHNLPPALALDSKSAWYGGCDCQGLCRKANVTKAYNEVECSRLADATGDRRGLAVHASAPLKNGETLLGILNVAAPDWSAFSPRSLALLNNAATMFAAALERAQLYDLLRERRIEEHASLLKFSRKLLAQHDLEGLMDYLVCEVCSLMQVDACALLLRGDVPEMLCFQATHGWKTAPVSNHRRVAYGSGTALGDAFHAQEAVFVQDLNDPSATQWQLDWLIEEDFRGHAAIPLVVDGGAIGVLLINTRQPHVWDADDARFLSLMSSQAALALEKARLHRAEIETMRLEEELAIGREIQLSLLPEACPTLPGWDFAAFYQPARLVGGDFYDFFILPDGQLGIVVADVAGKGVPAALFMALSRTVIRTSASNDCTPAEALLRSNRLLLQDTRSHMFLTAGYAKLDPQTGHLTYADGGHNPALVFRAATRTVERLKPHGMLLGAFLEIACEELTAHLDAGDILLLYTDGITEALNERQEEYGEDRLMEMLAACADQPAVEIRDAIVASVTAFAAGTPPADDLTLFVAKRRSGAR